MMTFKFLSFYQNKTLLEVVFSKLKDYKHILGGGKF